MMSALLSTSMLIIFHLLVLGLATGGMCADGGQCVQQQLGTSILQRLRSATTAKLPLEEEVTTEEVGEPAIGDAIKDIESSASSLEETRRHSKVKERHDRAGMLESDVASETTSGGKLRYYWDQIVADQQTKGYMNIMHTLLRVGHKDFLWSMQNHSGETRSKYHHKATHGPGGMAKVRFEWKENRYTGMFQKADNCVIRIANAAEPTIGRSSYNPNMAIKCYRDGLDEGAGAMDANLLTIWEIDGYDKIPAGNAKSCSFFDVPLSNHCGDRDNISMPLRHYFIEAFRAVSQQPLMLGTSPFAEADQSGNTVDKPEFPFALVFQPHESLRQIKCEFKDFMQQLRAAGQQRKGQVLYDVYAVHDPWYSRPSGRPDIQHIGSMILDDGFYTSRFGDSEVFFRHRFMESELEVLKRLNKTREAGWRAYVDPSSPHVKEEGAAWYEPFLP